MSESAPCSDTSEPTTWSARPGFAAIARISLFVAPILAGTLVLLVASRWFWLSTGPVGMLVWLAQASVVGACAASIADRQSRRLLPFATLLGLSLQFPGTAPSRFRLAAKIGSVRNADEHVAAVVERGLGNDLSQAAVEALNLVMVGSVHPRLTTSPTERRAAHADAIACDLGLDLDDRNKLAWSLLFHNIGDLCLPTTLDSSDDHSRFADQAAAGDALITPLGQWLGSWRFATSQRNEHWDGSGHPRGIGGERITLAGRILAVSDAYETLTTDSTPEHAKAQILAMAGTTFDPTVVRAAQAVFPLDDSGALAGRLPAVALPGATLHAAQAVATLAVAALMASTISVSPELLALEPDETITAPSESPSTTWNRSQIAGTDPAPTSPTTQRRDSYVELTATTQPLTPSTPSTSTTSSSSSTTTTSQVATTPVPTTGAPAITSPSTTAPTTTVSPTTSPSTTAPETTVSVSVDTTAAPSVGPVAVADAANVRRDKSKRVDVLENDTVGPSGSPIDIDSLAIVELPNHGTTEVKDGKINYRSDPDHSGEDTFTYRVCNGLGECSTAKVTITVR